MAVELENDAIPCAVMSGLRVGWVTGPKAFIEGCFRVWSEITVQFPCTLSQCVLAQMLRTWGTPGIDKHLRGIQVGKEHLNICKSSLHG